MAWLLVACTVLVAVGGILVTGQTHADSFDNAVDSPIIARFGGHTGLLLLLAAPGTRLPAFAATAVVALGCLLARRLNGAVLAALSVPLATSLDDYVLKPLVNRRYLGGLVYPSGHTAAVVTLAATLTVLLLPVVGSGSGSLRWLALLVIVLAWADSAVVAVAVMALRWHYFTDTVAGAALAIGVVSGLTLVLDLPRVRRWLGG